MNIVFMGTADFAVPSLLELLKAGYTVSAVFSQPDKPQGRGMKMKFSPVKEVALEYGIPVFQPESFKDGTAFADIEALSPDLIIVVAYGKILPQPILSYPQYGCINLHGSLLPEYRGAAPIQRAVLNGNEKTGVSLQFMVKELDAGPVISSTETTVGLYETAGELFDRLSILGADLLLNTIPDIISGVVKPIEQCMENVSYAPPLTKEMCPIDWSRPAKAVIKQIYGLNPWPVATMEIEGNILKVFSAKLGSAGAARLPGTIVSAGKNGIEVVCGDSETVVITEVQQQGKKRMPVSSYILGHPIQVHD